MNRLLLIITLIGFNATSFAQVDFGEPELDDALLQSKQYKRIDDYHAKRHTDGQNGDWLKQQAWNEVLANSKRIDMEPWQNFGPDTVSGRIISIAFHPTDANTFLVGSASGGLWKTENYGETWFPITDAFLTMGIGAVAYNPQNPNSILIASGEGYGFGSEFTQGFGVYISHDGGNTWNETVIVAEFDQSFAGMDIYWNPVDTSKIAVASSFGQYFSEDGGYNYVYTLDRIGGRMMADPSDPNRVYFTARYYSADFPGGLYISDDSGESWALSGSGLPIPSLFGYTSIAIHPIATNIIYLAVSQSAVEGSGPMKGLFKSVDSGASFDEIPSTQDIFCYPAPYDYICQGWYDNTILMDPEDPNILYAGGTRMWKSINGGIDWENIDLNPEETAYAIHADHHQTIFHPITGDLFDCNDGGVNYSGDGGETWTSISNGLVTHQFYSIAFAETDPDVVIGGAQDVGTFISTNAHEGHWINPLSGDGFGHMISHTDADVWYGTSYINLQRFKTTNAGVDWFTINEGTSGDQWRMPLEMHPIFHNVLLTSDNDFIYKSVNGGLVWSPVAAVGPIGTLEFDEQNPDLVYACDLFGSDMYRSIDGGNTWAILDSSPLGPITDIASDPLETGKVYVTVGSYGENNQLYLSENAGLTWSNISNNLPNVPTNTVAVSSYNNQEVYVGNDLGVWISLDGGINYEVFSAGLPAAIVVEDLHFYGPDTTVRIGTYGRGYWRTDAISKTYANLPSHEAKTNQIFAYPNPSNNVFQLSQAIGEYVIYDQAGKFIVRQSDLMIDLSNYAQGVYFVRAENYRLKLVKL
ncbi:MAG: T9SS type A sorting domain-containing protein [Crocinitomix sp.]|nr:T9SS type A sorting domain-containing protein [Crocinitomix sp.]